MNYNELVQLIGSVGFPIIACAALFWENHQNELRHLEESQKRDEALSNNTSALQELTLWLKSYLDPK